jgi:predicted Rossmann fold flavoprotein
VSGDADWDIAVIGAGAAGLMAAAWAVREKPGIRVIVLDGAAKLGAKILVAGGGRCNVTHHSVDETAYAGSSRNAIRKVLGRFSVAQTISFFRELGVELKREETGKLFPVTDDARTVLNALLESVRRGAYGRGAEIRYPARVIGLSRGADGFVLELANSAQALTARRVILATGGMSLPRTGSDGGGYQLAKSLGHTITKNIFPALVPLLLKKDHWLTALSGVTVDATLEVRMHTGKLVQAFANSTLITHFGLSGPSVLDVSRYWTSSVLEARAAGTPPPMLTINWLVGETPQALDEAMVGMGKQTPLAWMVARAKGKLPERLIAAIVARCGLEPSTTGATMSREQRRTLAEMMTRMELPVVGDRGYNFAEVTAGGVPLSEVRLESMESRVCPGLYLCGEILDVDGRIGGFNFQWAWASGHVAGKGAAAAPAESRP